MKIIVTFLISIFLYLTVFRTLSIILEMDVLFFKENIFQIIILEHTIIPFIFGYVIAKILKIDNFLYASSLIVIPFILA